MGDDSFETNFAHDIYHWQPTGFPYDFNSIMHYPAYATSTCRDCPVITYKDTDQAVETNDSGTFSAIDIKGAGHDGSFVCINVGAHTVDVSP